MHSTLTAIERRTRKFSARTNMKNRYSVTCSGLVISSMVVVLLLVTESVSGVSLQEKLSTRADTSCVGRCMEDRNDSMPCHCDDRCASFGNCCDDYIETCLNISQSSCYGRCFGQWGFIPDQTCYCDDQCSKYGNCCDDFVEECANITLCENRCFVWYDSGLECQCNDQCSDYGNCCVDYYESCLPGSCNSRCGNRNTTLGCQCDSKCSDENDCCEDFTGTCTTQDSCFLLCGSSYDSSRTCQCNDDCEKYGNCCEDYNTECTGLCDSRCGDRNTTLPCQCDLACRTEDDCCDDFATTCPIKEFYLCNEECDVVKDGCSCMPTCLDDNSCCTDYAESCQGGTAWLDDECTPANEMTCPNGFDKAPVILFSMDGFRNSYLYRDITPNLWKLASCGVHSPYTRSIYPTKTFPNHYTIATGLYPESHGIVANRFYDHELEDEFRLGAPQAYDPHWWGGEPIWVTASNQGQKSASYFWVGSDVNITRYPDYYVPFDSSVPDEERVHQVLKWLDLPAAERPSIITMYIEEVDGAGHDGGPDGHEVNVEIAKADEIAGMLMDGLKARSLDKCVNIMILADHGMANISCDRLTYVEPYGVNMDVVYFRGGPGGRIGKSKDKSEWDQFDPYDIKNKLQCQREETHFQTFLKFEYLPKRLHFAYNDRIEDVVILSDDEWLLGGKTGTYTSCNGGTHGWDNENKQMRAMFVAHGSSFKRGYNTSEGFDNFELYNLMCDMLDLTPAPNNGTRGSLNHLLKNPNVVVPPSSIETPQSCPYPTESNVATNKLGCSICENKEAEWNKLLDLTPEQISDVQLIMMLMGTPKIFPAAEGESVNYCMLTQPDYVTAYNWEKKMPYYTSFTLARSLRNMNDVTDCLRPDIRVPDENTASCSDYGSNQNVAPAYLFYPGFWWKSRSTAEILSNVVPVYNAFLPVWKRFAFVLDDWAGMYNGISVVVGPIFDYNYDGLADSAEIIDNNATFLKSGDKTSPPIPTHIFAVVAKCRDASADENIASCTSPDKITVVSFIIPNYKEEPCTYDLPQEDWVSQTLYQHVARVRDVELLTGISFFPDWFSGNANQDTMVSGLRVKVHLPEFGSAWLNDFLDNATPDPGIFPTTQGSSLVLPSNTLLFTSILVALFMKFFS